MNKIRTQLVAAGLLVMLTADIAVAQNGKALNQQEAVNLAEGFVARNGYTDKPVANPTQVNLEMWEDLVDIDNILAARSDLIIAKAVVAFIKDVNGESVWSVQFLFKKQDVDREYDFGREVRVSLEGRRIWMERDAIPVWRAHRMGDCLGDEKESSNKVP